MTPLHSIDFCPICGGGLCGIRIVGDFSDSNNQSMHGLVVCDECEAIWLEPDVTTVHQYPKLESAASPLGDQPLWGDGSRWATMKDIQTLGWTEAVNPELNAEPDAEVDSDLDSDEKLV